jgi:hypothetical protein
MLDFGPQFQNIILSTTDDQFGKDDLLEMLLAGAKLKGFFTATCYKRDGSIRWQEKNRNGVTNLGFNLMLDSTFRSASISPISTWYMSLISNTSFTTGLAAGDTMSSHTGWTEDSTHYTAANRPTWTPSAAASKQITNATPVSFAMNLDNTIIKGIFLTSDNTLGGTSGTLWATGLFGSDQTLFNGDTLKITYTVALS